MIDGKLPISSDFLSPHFKTPYHIFKDIATSGELKEILEEI
jgi:hypothetical protein